MKTKEEMNELNGKKVNELSEEELKQVAGSGDGTYKVIFIYAYNCPFCNKIHTFKAAYGANLVCSVLSRDKCENTSEFIYTGDMLHICGTNGDSVSFRPQCISYEFC